MSKHTKLQDAVNKAHNPELAKQFGMVYQVWDDGEITLQKSGDLLWQRSLHCLSGAIQVIGDIDWPEKSGKHGYAFVTDEDAENIRELIRECAIIEVKAL